MCFAVGLSYTMIRIGTFARAIHYDAMNLHWDSRQNLFNTGRRINYNQTSGSQSLYFACMHVSTETISTNVNIEKRCSKKKIAIKLPVAHRRLSSCKVLKKNYCFFFICCSNEQELEYTISKYIHTLLFSLCCLANNYRIAAKMTFCFNTHVKKNCFQFLTRSFWLFFFYLKRRYY